MISIIICTHNRAEVLKEALNSFCKMQGLEDVAHELIIIDNKSSDNTRMIVEGFSHIKTIQYILEEELGLSRARNRGISESTGEIIAFVDDDVLFTENWLIELKKGICQWPDAAVYGGKAVAKWERPKPLWFVDDGFFQMRSMVAHYEPNIPEGYMNRFPYGCNMSLKRSIPEMIEFDENLGRKGVSLLADEEIDLFFRIRDMGGKFVYLPKAMVFHRIMHNREEKQYYLKWIKTRMNSQIYFDKKHNLKRKHILGVPIYSVKRLLTISLKILVDVFLFRDKNRFFSYKLNVLRQIYYIRLYRKNRRYRHRIAI